MVLSQQLIESSSTIPLLPLSSPSPWTQRISSTTVTTTSITASSSSSSSSKRKSAQAEFSKWSQLSSDATSSSRESRRTLTRKSLFSQRSSSMTISRENRGREGEGEGKKGNGRSGDLLLKTVQESFDLSRVCGIDLAMGFDFLSRKYHLKVDQDEDYERLERLLQETSYHVTLSVFYATCCYSTYYQSDPQSMTKKKIRECKLRVSILARNCLYYLIQRKKGKIDFLCQSPPPPSLTCPWKIEPNQRLQRGESWNSPQKPQSEQDSGMTMSSESESPGDLRPIHAVCQSLNSSILQVERSHTLDPSHSSLISLLLFSAHSWRRRY
jgi:hypothetical protein